MQELLLDFLLSIPQAVGNLTSWLTSPISEKYLNISPLAILGAGGTTFLIALISIHVVKLFI